MYQARPRPTHADVSHAHKVRVTVVAGRVTYVLQRFTGPCPIPITLNWHPPQLIRAATVSQLLYLVQVGDISNLPPLNICLTHLPGGFCDRGICRVAIPGGGVALVWYDTVESGAGLFAGSARRLASFRVN
jgi:hypothetical protein